MLSSSKFQPCQVCCPSSQEQYYDSFYGSDQWREEKEKACRNSSADPDAEVVSLSPRTLLEADRYVCEICGQGFQREQNLQMHLRRHKVPWKLVRRQQGGEVSGRNTKRVFVCPEASCLHHDPRHALGDLVGIKKHFRRKHSNHRQWAWPTPSTPTTRPTSRPAAPAATPATAAASSPGMILSSKIL